MKKMSLEELYNLLPKVLYKKREDPYREFPYRLEFSYSPEISYTSSVTGRQGKLESHWIGGYYNFSYDEGDPLTVFPGDEGRAERSGKELIDVFSKLYDWVEEQGYFIARDS